MRTSRFLAGPGRLRAAFAGATAGLMAMTLASCAPAYVTSSTAPVNLIVAAVNGGAPLTSDVRIGAESSTVCSDFVNVAVAVRNRNLNAPAPNVPAAVLVQSYEVRYFRTDGRAIEGIDVPYRITGFLTLAVDVEESGTTNVPIEIVRRQAKLEPPLSAIFQTAVLTAFAEVTLYGETIAGQPVSGSGRMQIDFADFADEGTGCQPPEQNTGG